MEHGHHPKIADHDEHHEHSHEHVHRGVEKKRLTMVAILTGSMMVIEGIGGYVTNSLALLSDAFHMLTHFGALMISLSAIIIATRFQSEDINIRGAFLHMIGDTLSSVAVIIAGLIIYFTNWVVVDPIASVVISIMILIWSAGRIYESVHVLLESFPKGIKIDEAEQSIRAVPMVKDVHDIHIWQITSGMYSMTCHAIVEDMSISGAQHILKQIQTTLDKEFHITHANIQLEHSM